MPDVSVLRGQRGRRVRVQHLFCADVVCGAVAAFRAEDAVGADVLCIGEVDGDWGAEGGWVDGGVGAAC